MNQLIYLNNINNYISCRLEPWVKLQNYQKFKFNIRFDVYVGNQEYPKRHVNIRGSKVDPENLKFDRIEALYSQAVLRAFEQLNEPAISQIQGTFAACLSNSESKRIIEMKFTQKIIDAHLDD